VREVPRILFKCSDILDKSIANKLW